MSCLWDHLFFFQLLNFSLPDPGCRLAFFIDLGRVSYYALIMCMNTTSDGINSSSGTLLPIQKEGNSINERA